MKKVLTSHHISLRHAWAGLVWAFRTQPNFRVHIVLSATALFFAWYLGISSVETLIIVFTIILGLVVEMLNTALESMTDLITREWREEAKVAKDVAAGMMLLTAAGALIVAGIIFGPYLGAF